MMSVFTLYWVTCERVPKWGTGRKEISASRACKWSSIFVLALYWEPLVKRKASEIYNSDIIKILV